MQEIHLIGNAHLDPVWIWRWPEGYQEIKATFRSALDRMRETPGFIFTCAGAAYYEWIEENAPEMFAEIKARVQEGRWRIVGGWWVQPDCNIPSGEAFVRQALYSQRYFQTRFGVRSRVGYNVDSFGHNAMLPQILVQSGMDAYVMMRPSPEEKELPGELFWWESADGSRVLTFRIPFGYLNQEKTEGEGALGWKIEETRKLYRQDGHPYMLFYGVGNHGGGPTRAALRQLTARMQAGEADLVFSDPERFFAAIRAEVAAGRLLLPVVRDELQHHASGCYAAQSEIKRHNRRAEHLLLVAEKFAAVAAHILGLPAQEPSLWRAWRRVLFNQFHDILAGTSIPAAYTDARWQHGEALALGSEVLNMALQRLSWAIDTQRPQAQGQDRQDSFFPEASGAGLPLVLFNPHSWPVRVPCQLNRCAGRIEDDAGHELPLQQVQSDNLTFTPYHSLFIAELPPLGYKVYWIHKGDWEAVRAARENAEGGQRSRRLETGPGLQVKGGSVVTPWMRVKLDQARGCLKELVDLRLPATLLREAARPVVMSDPGDTWGHGILRFQEQSGEFIPTRVEWREEGPLRACWRVYYAYGSSTLRQDFLFYRDFPFIDVCAEVDWHERQKLLKIVFPVQVAAPTFTAEIPYGFIRRPGNGEEEPIQQWVDVSGNVTGKRDGVEASGVRAGVAILNRDKYSAAVCGTELQLTILRSPLAADHGLNLPEEERAQYPCLDQGLQGFAYRIYPHQGDWAEAGVVQAAYEFNVAPVAIWESYHAGSLPREQSFLTLSQPNVVVTVLKRAEDGSGDYILRCYETAGRATTVTFQAAFLGRSWEAALGPAEIKTFRIPSDPCLPVTAVNCLEEPVTVPGES